LEVKKDYNRNFGDALPQAGPYSSTHPNPEQEKNVLCFFKNEFLGRFAPYRKHLSVCFHSFNL